MGAAGFLALAGALVVVAFLVAAAFLAAAGFLGAAAFFGLAVAVVFFGAVAFLVAAGFFSVFAAAGLAAGFLPSLTPPDAPVACQFCFHGGSELMARTLWLLKDTLGNTSLQSAVEERVEHLVLGEVLVIGLDVLLEG